MFTNLQHQKLEPNDCRQLWRNHQFQRLTLDYGCWLSSRILYLELKVDRDLADLTINKARLLACGQSKYGVAHTKFFAISETKIAGVAYFSSELHLGDGDRYQIAIERDRTLTLVTGFITQQAFNLEFIEYLYTKPDALKHLIRENFCRSLIQLTPAALRSHTGDIIRKIQHFLKIPAVNYIDPNLPFKIFIDHAIPLKYDGLFIAGWLQDPYQMLEKIVLVSDLGFSLELPSKDIYRLERQDVRDFLQNTRYGNFEQQLGFCSYVTVPQTIRQSIQDIAELHGFRFLVRLKGAIEIEIVPNIKYSDYYGDRRQIMQIASPDKISSQVLANCIAPAGLKVQQLCIEQAKIKEVTVIGSPILEPLTSIIIPLYRRLDFIKVQLAKMAHDLATRQCEIIYVLDSPEQSQELKSLLKNYCLLYDLPLKLVTMERNSGYGAANNAGVSQARGKYLLLLNSDVFPQTKGWMEKMREFYASNSKIGVLGAKLLYEDGSLQHAGMFFAQTTFPFWLTLHYYKGLPGNYAPAQETKPVPAVTGACMMISQELYHRVGGMTTDYIIGDFEDSDLCLKCDALGYQSWYFADAALYHLERQSVPLNSIYSGSLAWRLNGRLHQERWGERIAQLMKIYQ